METTFTSWLALAGLGAFHGLNPGMGWLFAVALGMQERKRTRGVAGAHSADARTRAGDCSGYRGRDGCRYRPGSWHAAVAGGSPAGRPGRAAVVPSRAPALGGHAGWYGRPDALVVFDGIGTWRGT